MPYAFKDRRGSNHATLFGFLHDWLVCHPVRDWLIANYMATIFFGIWVLLPSPLFCSKQIHFNSGEMVLYCYGNLPLLHTTGIELGLGVALILVGWAGLHMLIEGSPKLLHVVQIALVFWWFTVLSAFLVVSFTTPAVPVYVIAVVVNIWLFWRTVGETTWMKSSTG